MPASLFTTANIVALFRAAADSNGTLAHVCAIAAEYGDCEVSPAVLSGWLRKGRRFGDRGMDDHPYAVFAREFLSRLPDRHAVRMRGSDAASASLRLAISEIETQCECGRPKDRGLSACTLCTSMDGEVPGRPVSSRRKEMNHAAAR